MDQTRGRPVIVLVLLVVPDSVSDNAFPILNLGQIFLAARIHHVSNPAGVRLLLRCLIAMNRLLRALCCKRAQIDFLSHTDISAFDYARENRKGSFGLI
jgi:hypothetical protein